jgi:hypothetical protein
MTWMRLSVYGWLARESFTCENKELVFIARRPVTNMACGWDGKLCRPSHGVIRYAALAIASALVRGLSTASRAGAAVASW